MDRPEIVSASRRTDLPAFHAQWFLNRLRAGWCHWVHPYTARVRRVSLRPEDVAAIVFWTREPGPLVPHVRALREDGHALLFQFTVNGFGPPVEARNPPVERALARFEELARILGPDAVLWRYDPIVFSSRLSAAWHVRQFTRLAGRLRGLTRRCTFSFVDLYGKTRRNLARVEAESGERHERPEVNERRALARELAAIAAGHEMALLSCCDDSLTGHGVGKSRCVDPAAVALVRGGAPPDAPPRPTRPDCGCVRSVDVGTYDTCAFGCAYCYAVSGGPAARRRLAEADPRDSLLWRPPSLRGVDLRKLETGT